MAPDRDLYCSHAVVGILLSVSGQKALQPHRKSFGQHYSPYEIKNWYLYGNIKTYNYH